MVDTKFLEAGLSDLGINNYDGGQIDRLICYYNMVIEANERFNLTTITEWEDFVLKHFLDSLAIVKTGILLNDDINIIDIGTGAGFPGIPLKIMFPGIRLTLLDSLKKRVNFLEDVVSELDLEVVSCFHGRAEEFGRDENYRENYNLAVSRAVANYSMLLEYALPLTAVGGHFVAYKGSDYKEEIEEGKKAAEVLGGGEISVRQVELPGSEIERAFVLVEKVGETPGKYPRRAANIKRGFK